MTAAIQRTDGVPALPIPVDGWRAAAPTEPASLLAPPAPLSAANLNDALSLVYALIARQASNDLVAGEHDVNTHLMSKNYQHVKEKEAIKRAQDAESSGDGFFGCVGKILGDSLKDAFEGRLDKELSDLKDNTVAAYESPAFWREVAVGATKVLKTSETFIASSVAFGIAGPAGAAYVVENPDSPAAKTCAIAGEVALTVATGGGASALVLASALLLSIGGELIADTKCMDGALGEGSSQWIGAGMEIGGTALAGGAGNAGASLDKGARIAAGATTVARGSLQVSKGVAEVRVGHFDARAQDARADAKQAKVIAERIERWVEIALGDVKELKRSHERALASVQGAIQTNNQALVSASSMRA